ncbi:MAG: hypothetical protein PHE27_07085 [Alphaproteobacteria bacterium]|nr:hypothetical protein [Alphaproteobacteria bacterium]
MTRSLVMPRNCLHVSGEGPAFSRKTSCDISSINSGHREHNGRTAPAYAQAAGNGLCKPVESHSGERQRKNSFGCGLCDHLSRKHKAFARVSGVDGIAKIFSSFEPSGNATGGFQEHVRLDDLDLILVLFVFKHGAPKNRKTRLFKGYVREA